MHTITSRINLQTALIVVGLILTMLVAMFRPSGAEAVLPKSALVYTSDSGSSSSTIKYSDLKDKEITGDYSVIYTGKGKARKVKFTGIPMSALLTAAKADTSGVNFVKVRLGRDDDSVISLQPIVGDEAGRPTLIIGDADAADNHFFSTPAIVPGQPDSGKPVYEAQFANFTSKEKITVIPARAGAKILNVQMEKPEKQKSGQYRLEAKVSGGSGEKDYVWYRFDNSGNSIKVSNCTGRICTTDDAVGNGADRMMTVVVTDENGSTGTNFQTYVQKKKEKGKTSDPDSGSTGSTGSAGTGGNGAAGNGAAGNGTPGGSTYVPPSSTPVPPTTTTPAPPVTTPAPTTPQATVDSSAITNLAQNVSSDSGYTAVSGVLLSAPTVPAASAGGNGQPLSVLPQQVTEQLNSIFQPVDDPGDIWPYLLAVLFALSLSGAIREWVKP